MTPRMVSWAHCIAAKEQRSLHSYHGFLWNPDEWNNKRIVGKEKYVAIVSTVVETASAADTLAACRACASSTLALGQIQRRRSSRR